MKKELTVFILDDEIIPSNSDYVEDELHSKVLDSNVLMTLSKSWNKQQHPQKLITLIVESEHFKNNVIKLYGFTHPSLALNSIDDGILPDILIFDWEYGSEPHLNSSNWLKDILKLTDAFIFVYSKVRNEIPPFLNKSEFDTYSNRFQLFLKGDIDNSVFSTEEFVLQYILSRVSIDNKIIINGDSIEFEKNGYLSDSSDILHLENLFGRVRLLSKLKDSLSKINNVTIEEAVSDMEVSLILDEDKGMIVLEDAVPLFKGLNASKKISPLEVIRNFGIFQLIDILEIGFVKVSTL